MSRIGSRLTQSSNTTDWSWRELGNAIFCVTVDCSKAGWRAPRNAFAYGKEDIVVLAVALMAGIARAHAFEQGNKRTAFAALRLFLRGNGFDTAFGDTMSWADEIISLVEHRSSKEDFARAIRPYIEPRP